VCCSQLSSRPGGSLRAAAFSAGGDGGRKPPEQSFPPPTLRERRHCGLARRLVAPTPSMRFVSAHFGAQTGRCRGPCQLKTSQQQASQQLRHHFVAVQAFAFACPKVPGRVGPFLRSPFLSRCETRQNCRGSTDRRGKQTLGSLIGGVNPLLNGGLAIKNSTGLPRAGVCQSVGADLGLPQSHNLKSMGASHNDRWALASFIKKGTLPGWRRSPEGPGDAVDARLRVS
jgi:hypothetical protein